MIDEAATSDRRPLLLGSSGRGRGRGISGGWLFAIIRDHLPALLDDFPRERAFVTVLLRLIWRHVELLEIEGGSD
jgi:hypothetical protein